MVDRADIEILTDRVEVIACRKCGTHLQTEAHDPFSQMPCSKCGTQQIVPVRLGHFLLLQLLGKGGMGAVYKALDQTLGRYVALKVMRKELGEDQQALDNFLREARSAAALNHPNVVQLYSCGQEKGQPYIVMEFVDGGRLDQLTREGKLLEETRLLKIAVDVAQGLAAAHEIGLVHGDIKPANIMFGRDGTAKVVDFGLARFAASQQAPGEIWGTPFYIAPEKVQKLPEDHRSDIYSLGATLFHALTGVPPFDAETSTEVVVARLKRAAPPLRGLRSDLHLETAALIARMLEADAARRYPTYTSLLADLRETYQVSRTTPLPPAPTEEKTPGRKWIFVAAAALLILAVAGGGYLWYAKQQARKAAQPERKILYYMLVGGKQVPVYEDDAAAQESAPPASDDAVPVPTPAEPAPPPPLFAGDLAGTLEKSLRELTPGTSQDVEARIESAIYAGAAEASADRAWARVFQATACWIGDRPEPAQKYLAEVRNASFPESAGPEAHPGLLARNTARFLLGDVSPITLYAKTGGWPDWYRNLLPFFTGYDALRQGKISEAQSALSDYAKQPAGDPAWPYALQAQAAEWTRSMDEWKELAKQLDQWMADGKPEEAAARLAEFQKTAPWFLAGQMQKKTEKLNESLDALQQTNVAELKAHQDRVQQDLDRLDVGREALAPWIHAKDFKKAADQFAKLSADLKTDEGKALHRIHAAAFRRMDALKDYLTDRMQAEPFGGAAGAESGGNVLGATRDGLRVALGGQGEVLRPWEQVSPRLFLWIANYYLSKPGLAAGDRADKLLSLAVYCYEGGAFDQAARYAQQVAELNAELTPSVRSFMPDILPEK